MVLLHLFSAISHTRIVLSSETERRYFPRGWNRNPRTQLSWPTRVKSAAPLIASHTRMDLSREPETFKHPTLVYEKHPLEFIFRTAEVFKAFLSKFPISPNFLITKKITLKSVRLFSKISKFSTKKQPESLRIFVNTYNYGCCSLCCSVAICLLGGRAKNERKGAFGCPLHALNYMVVAAQHVLRRLSRQRPHHH